MAESTLHDFLQSIDWKTTKITSPLWTAIDWVLIEEVVELSNGNFMYIGVDNTGLSQSYRGSIKTEWRIYVEPEKDPISTLPEILVPSSIGMAVVLRNGIVTVLSSYNPAEVKKKAPYTAHLNQYRSTGKISHARDEVDHPEDIVRVL